jgi:hypothetical protein
MTIFLDNIAAAAYGRMVPVTTIIPVNGSIDGTMKVTRVASDPVCEGAFTMRNVKFAPNPLILPDPADAEVVRTAVARLDYSGPFTLCDSEPATSTPRPVSPDSPFVPPASGILVALNAQATSQASPGVRALVNHDRQQLGGQAVTSPVDELTSALAQELGLRIARSIAGRAGEAVVETMPKPSGNALTGGLRSVGGGLKRLFGGGK